MKNRHITLAITGASGVQYGLRLLECLLQAGERVNLLISSAAHVVISTETEHKFGGRPEEINAYFNHLYSAKSGQLQVFGKEQWMAPIASGSGAPRAMVVCPCSSATLSSIAHGSSDNLIERAADVMLKEQRKLILVTREMPVSAIHLENMLKLARLGVAMLPASPGFYHHPKTIDHLIDFVVARVLDHLDIEHNLAPRWGESTAQ
ncbi:MAG: UbiX family flavin prenyltransferase [Gammaproteobacteria bacterium]|nr:UbiX family flavin prenyltransferase [Gammaproteobacteria bacterium]